MTLKDDGIEFPSDFFRFGRSNRRFRIKVLNSFTFTSNSHQYYFRYLLYTTPKLCGLNDDIYFCWPICHLGRAQQEHLSLLHLAAAGVAWRPGAWVICRLLVHLSGGWAWLLAGTWWNYCMCLLGFLTVWWLAPEEEHSKKRTKQILSPFMTCLRSYIASLFL